MQRIRYLVFVGLIFFLFSCGPVIKRNPINSKIIKETPKVGLPSSTSSPITPSKASSKVEIPLPTKTLSPSFTTTQVTAAISNTPKPFLNLCSPLAEQSIREILEIVSDPYNPPGPGKEARHHGIDLSYYRRKDRNTIEGEHVQAWLKGRVVAVVKDQLPYGNMVIIETPQSVLPPDMITRFQIVEDESLFSLYAHFRGEPLVDLGDQVMCGQILGEVGVTGYNIVNPHLHIESRIGPSDWMFREGMAYYDTRTTEAERSNYELWRTSGVFRHFDPIEIINYYLINLVEE